MRILTLFMAFIFLTVCGYRPTSKIIESTMGDLVYVEVAIRVEDPKNSVLIKDAIKEAFISRLGRKIVSKNLAQTEVYASLNSISFPAIIKKDGFNIAYRANVRLSLKTVYEDGRVENLSTSGSHDFFVKSHNVISDTERFSAIKNASLDALDEYIAVLSIRGLHEYDE